MPQFQDTQDGPTALDCKRTGKTSRALLRQQRTLFAVDRSRSESVTFPYQREKAQTAVTVPSLVVNYCGHGNLQVAAELFQQTHLALHRARLPLSILQGVYHTARTPSGWLRICNFEPELCTLRTKVERALHRFSCPQAGRKSFRSFLEQPERVRRIPIACSEGLVPAYQARLVGSPAAHCVARSLEATKGTGYPALTVKTEGYRYRYEIRHQRNRFQSRLW